MKNASLIVKISSSRIATLLTLAEARTLEKDEMSEKLARRYVSIARKISSHYRVGMPRGLKFRICKNCGNFLVPGVNCRVRLASLHGYAAYICECGAERHIPYKNKRGA